MIDKETALEKQHELETYIKKLEAQAQILSSISFLTKSISNDMMLGKEIRNLVN